MDEIWHNEPLDQRAVCLKRRRSMPGSPQPLNSLPDEWRALLTRWVQRGGNSRWETLRNDAGVTQVQRADSLRDWLLKSGWAAVSEHRKSTDLNNWLPDKLELLHLPQLRNALGLPDKENEALRWVAMREELLALDNESLHPAILALDELSAARALARQDLLFQLHAWQQRQMRGTRRDFSLFARSDTKAVNEADWNWLEGVLDLAQFEIERHTPLLLISAPLSLKFAHGGIDLAACPDFGALTPATLQTLLSVEGVVDTWLLVENRTSFERQGRQRAPGTGILWLPGFPPSWWMDAIGRLLDFFPAPAHIACDPDPAGMAIALKAATPWIQRQLKWQPWKMSAHDLATLPSRKPLSALDRQQAQRLIAADNLPESLRQLGQWMLEHDEKGEQEGYL